MTSKCCGSYLHNKPLMNETKNWDYNEVKYKKMCDDMYKKGCDIKFIILLEIYESTYKKYCRLRSKRHSI